MTALGPAGFAIIAFVAAVGGLASIYAVEQYVRRLIGAAPAR